MLGPSRTVSPATRSASPRAQAAARDRMLRTGSGRQTRRGVRRSRLGEDYELLAATPDRPVPVIGAWNGAGGVEIRHEGRPVALSVGAFRLR